MMTERQEKEKKKNETKEIKSEKKCSYSNFWVLMYDEPDDG